MDVATLETVSDEYFPMAFVEGSSVDRCRGLVLPSFTKPPIIGLH